MDDVAARNVAAARAMLAAFSAGDPGPLLAHVAPDVRYEAPFYPTMASPQSRDELAAMLEQVTLRFSEVEYQVVDAFAAQDPDVVVVECRGHHVVAGTGRPYENHYVMILRFVDGLVVHWREFSNPDVYRRATAPLEGAPPEGP